MNDDLDDFSPMISFINAAVIFCFPWDPGVLNLMHKSDREKFWQVLNLSNFHPTC